MSQKEFKITVQKANKSLIIILLIPVAAILLAILVGEVLERISRW
jgi:hypothetical protein